MTCNHQWEVRDTGYTEKKRLPWVHYLCQDCPTRRLVCDERDYVITDEDIEPYMEAA